MCICIHTYTYTRARANIYLVYFMKKSILYYNFEKLQNCKIVK